MANVMRQREEKEEWTFFGYSLEEWTFAGITLEEWTF